MKEFILLFPPNGVPVNASNDYILVLTLDGLAGQLIKFCNDRNIEYISHYVYLNIVSFDYKNEYGQIVKSELWLKEIKRA